MCNKLSQIDEYVFLTGVDGIEINHFQLRKALIARVLTVSTHEVDPSYRINGMDYKFIHMRDMLTQNILSSGILHDALTIIEDAVDKQLRIAIHCEMGMSRSPTVVMAYLMRKHGWGMQQALDFIRARRPVIRPNDSFLRQLIMFHQLECRCDPETLRQSKEYQEFEAMMQLNGWRITQLTNETRSFYTLSESHTNSRGSRYCCKKCRSPLFFDFNVLGHPLGGESTANYSYDIETSPSPICATIDSNKSSSLSKCAFRYLLTPMEWMELGSFEGKINCPKCGDKIGHYNWAGKQCLMNEASDNSGSNGSCGAFITPWIHVQPSKVDAFAMPCEIQGMEHTKIVGHAEKEN